MQRYEYIKILGIPFSEDLQNTIKTNWKHTINKMENYIRKITTRTISLNGKAIIINTLILSKTTFLSNVVPTHEETLSKIYTILFNYLWHNKKLEPIARKTLFLPKKKGGLNIKEPEGHTYSMRIKHLLTLKQKEHKPTWMQIATYWLAKEIYNYNKDYHHLQNNNILKAIKSVPFYYRDLTYDIKTQNLQIPNVKNKTKTIYKNILEKGPENHIINGQKKWKEKIINLDFTKIWKNTFFSYSKPKTKDLLYKILHHTIPTNSFIYKISKDKIDLTPNCNYCNKTEDNIHLLITCNRIRNIWTHFQPYYRQLTKKKTKTVHHNNTSSP